MQRNYRFKPRFVAGYGAGSGPTPAVLSLPIGLPLGNTSAYVGATSDLAAGTLYYVVTTSATPPSAAQIIAGQDHTGSAAAASGNAAAASGANAFTATGLASNTAYYAYRVQNNGADSNVLAGSVFTTLTTGTSDTSFDNLIAAMSVPPTTLRQGEIARMIQALYASGTWAKTDAMWVMAAHDEQASRLNWIAPGSFTLTAINSPTFTTDRGWAGNNTSSYLDTAWDASNNGSQFQQNDAHMSLYARTAGGGNVPAFGTGTGFNNGVNARTGTNGQVRLNNGSTFVSATSGGTLPLQMIGRRIDSANVTIVRDGVAQTAVANTSGARSSVDLNFGRWGNTYTSSQCSGGSVGANLDDTQALDFYNAWHTYMVAVGADT